MRATRAWRMDYRWRRDERTDGVMEKRWQEEGWSDGETMTGGGTNTVDRVIIERALSVLLCWPLNLQNEAINMKDAIFREGFEEVLLLVTDEAKPWNLRTRRAACKEPKENNNGYFLSLNFN
ncbi:hypothetical protein LguiA_016555 [Lonicera macranthoides]